MHKIHDILLFSSHKAETYQRMSSNYISWLFHDSYSCLPSDATLERGYATIGCLSVCPSVCNIEVLWSYRSEYFETIISRLTSLRFWLWLDPASAIWSSEKSETPLKIRVEWGWGHLYKMEMWRRCGQDMVFFDSRCSLVWKFILHDHQSADQSLWFMHTQPKCTTASKDKMSMICLIIWKACTKL